MFSFNEIRKSFLVALWFMFLTFPIMVIRVNTIYKTIEWRWERMLMVGIGAFFPLFSVAISAQTPRGRQEKS